MSNLEMLESFKSGAIKRVLDPCCGSRMFWFDHQHPDVVFGDARHETLTVIDRSHGNASGVRTLRIEPDVLPRIFNAFEQGEKTWTRRFGGLGLGLSIAKAVVELHNGSLAAYSAGHHQGAVFTVELDTLASSSGDIVANVAAVPHQERQLKILLVEDHADTLRILSRLLEKWGYIVRGSDCVAKALDLAAKESFDILISDLGLPDGSGLDIIRYTKEHYGLRGIALSGFGTEEDLRNSLAAGFEVHLTKPVGVEGLRAALERISSEKS